ncbi:Protein of unknown function (DUF1644) [Quillaja saponaria]|uniref:Uncharacterized protein n=1 Tax=Quillaja saponaria TaxID=32244 RepID=A0AAD7LF06_QUISA|nr:Protein of unknown function (DUF1644) [Quillaja saponaria]KAJ7956648.1 Protein of unknown function (DUF1644) [Quillaja saponaria]
MLLNINMPKERRDRSVSLDRGRVSPLSSSSSRTKRSAPDTYLETEENVKEWEDARCPVCMEHPHNAVLLICSSHEKGCRPYMCNTSYRHSNCLDQFCKSFAEPSPTITELESQLSVTNTSPTETPELTTVTEVQEERSEGSVTTEPLSCEHQEKRKLLCPLCRGQIKEWKVVEAARCFMNEKSRSCSSETCDFSGTYTDLRQHARLEHPLVRPSDVDPERQHSWRRLERQRDFGDLLSTLQSAVGEEMVDDSILPIDGGGLLTVIFFIRYTRGSNWSSTSRSRAQMSSRRRSTRHWGESYDGETGSSSRDDDNGSSDGDAGPWRRRVRRRTTPDNQQ